jgi:plastocyanin
MDFPVGKQVDSRDFREVSTMYIHIEKGERLMKKKLPLILLAALLAITLVACGGGLGGASTNLTVAMTDFHFTPDTFTVPAGKEITVNATNNGAVEHELVIFKLGQTAGDKFGDEDEGNIYWEVQSLPGETKTEKFTAPTEPGEYYLTCGIAGHLEAGMIGKLIVVAP